MSRHIAYPFAIRYDTPWEYCREGEAFMMMKMGLGPFDYAALGFSMSQRLFSFFFIAGCFLSTWGSGYIDLVLTQDWCLDLHTKVIFLKIKSLTYHTCSKTR